MFGSLLHGGFDEIGHGGFGYDWISQGPGGARIHYSGGRDDVHVSLPGRACGALGENNLRMLAWWGTATAVTRLDLYSDDHERRVHPRVLYDSSEEAVTHTDRRRWSWHEDKSDGATCYIGAKSSAQMLRVYDKAAESNGENNAIRWELQSRRIIAQIIAKRLISEDWRQVWAQNLVRLVDFRSRVSGRGDRGERLPWFEEIVGAAEKAELAIPKRIQTMDQLTAWMRRQVAPSLAVGFEYFGGDLQFLIDLLEEGRNRWTAKHHALLNSVR
jgi:phage replication initiation protein